MDDIAPKTSRVPAISKSWRIINYISTKPDASISEIAKMLGLSKSTVSDIVRSLCDENVLMRRADEPRFRLGPELIAVGSIARRQLPDRRVVREILRAFAMKWDSNVIITQLLDRTMQFVIVDSIAVPGSSAFVAAVGAQLSFTSRAVGRAYLAGLSPGAADKLIERWRRQTEAEFDLDDFLGPIEEARSRGFVVNRGEYSGESLGEINAVSVPLMNRAGDVAYVLAVVGYPRTLPSEKLAEVGRDLAETATRIEAVVT